MENDWRKLLEIKKIEVEGNLSEEFQVAGALGILGIYPLSESHTGIEFEVVPLITFELINLVYDIGQELISIATGKRKEDASYIDLSYWKKEGVEHYAYRHGDYAFEKGDFFHMINEILVAYHSKKEIPYRQLPGINSRALVSHMMIEHKLLVSFANGLRPDLTEFRLRDDLEKRLNGIPSLSPINFAPKR